MALDINSLSALQVRKNKLTTDIARLQQSSDFDFFKVLSQCDWNSTSKCRGSIQTIALECLNDTLSGVNSDIQTVLNASE